MIEGVANGAVLSFPPSISNLRTAELEEPFQDELVSKLSR